MPQEMYRKSKHTIWQNNRYMLVEAKKARVSSQVLGELHSTGLRSTGVPTIKPGITTFLFAIAFFNCFLFEMAEAAHPGMANVKQPSKPVTSEDPLIAVTVGATPTLAKMEATSSQTKSSAPSVSSNKKICSTAILVGNFSVPVRCVPMTQMHYRTNPAAYFEDVSLIQSMFERMTRSQQCKLETIARLLKGLFQITLDNSVILGEERIYGIYNSRGHLGLRPKLLKSSAALANFVHESQHGFMHALNRRDKRDIRKNEMSLCLPEEVNQTNPRTALFIQEGKENIIDLLSLFDKTYSVQASINTLEWHKRIQALIDGEKTVKVNLAQLKKLETLTKNYEPKLITYFTYPKNLIENNIIDPKTFELRQPRPLMHENSKIYLYIVKSEKNGDLAMLSGYTASKDEPQYRMKAALLDGYYALNLVKQRHAKDTACYRVNEADAHLHEIYDENLMAFFLPKLAAYHEGRMDDEHRACLSRPT